MIPGAGPRSVQRHLYRQCTPLSPEKPTSQLSPALLHPPKVPPLAPRSTHSRPALEDIADPHPAPLSPGSPPAGPQEHPPQPSLGPAVEGQLPHPPLTWPPGSTGDPFLQRWGFEHPPFRVNSRFLGGGRGAEGWPAD